MENDFIILVVIAGVVVANYISNHFHEKRHKLINKALEQILKHQKLQEDINAETVNAFRAIAKEKKKEE